MAHQARIEKAYLIRRTCDRPRRVARKFSMKMFLDLEDHSDDRRFGVNQIRRAIGWNSTGTACCSACDLVDLLGKSINPSLYILVDRFFTAVCSCKSPCMIIVNATSSWPVQQSAQSSRKQEKGEFFAGFRMTKQFALVVIRESKL